MTLLEIKGLKIAYGGINAVKGIDLIVEDGEMVALIGANGAGKTLDPEVRSAVFFCPLPAASCMAGWTSPAVLRTRWSSRDWRWCPKAARYSDG